MPQDRDSQSEVRRLLLEVDAESPRDDIRLAIEILDEEPDDVLAQLLLSTTVDQASSP